MPKLILLSELDDTRAVVKAFQEAMDTVVNPKAVNRVITDRYHHRIYQHVHPKPNQPAVGCVIAVLGDVGQEEQGSLFVKIYTEGYYSGPNVAYVPPQIAKRLVVSLKDTSLQGRLTLEESKKTFGMHMQASLQVFRDHPWGVIAIR
jgi:hypothetical protein